MQKWVEIFWNYVTIKSAVYDLDLRGVHLNAKYFKVNQFLFQGRKQFHHHFPNDSTHRLTSDLLYKTQWEYM